MILNVYKCEIRDNPLTTKQTIAENVARKTGVATSSVFKVVREYKNTHTFSPPNTNKKKIK